LHRPQERVPMPTTSRHAIGLVLLLLLAATLSGCFRSAGGSLEPTPVTFGEAAQLPPVPSLTATTEQEPTPEIATEPPTPIPPSPTSADLAALPGDLTGLLSPTAPVIALLPTNTSIPLPTPAPLLGPTATFTSVPFNPLPPTPT